MVPEVLDVTGLSANEIKVWLDGRAGDLELWCDTQAENDVTVNAVADINLENYRRMTWYDGIKASSLKIVGTPGTDIAFNSYLLMYPEYNLLFGSNMFDLVNTSETVYMFENLTVTGEIGSTQTQFLSDYVFLYSDVSAVVTARSVKYIGCKVRNAITATDDVVFVDSEIGGGSTIETAEDVIIDGGSLDEEATVSTGGDLYILNGAEVSGDVDGVEGEIIYGRTKPDFNGDFYGLGEIDGDREFGRVVNKLEESYTINRVFGGAKISAEAELIVTGTIETTINCGEFLGAVGNGSEITSAVSDSLYEQGHSVLNINGGTFGSYVYAGAYGKGGRFNGDEGIVNARVDSTELNITGGEFNSYILAGCGALSSKRGALTEVANDAKLFMDAGGDNKIYINSNVYGGSMGKGVVRGDTVITLSGLGSNLIIAPKVYFSGSSEAGYGPSRSEGETYVLGERKLVFSGFTGEFTARMNNGFDVMSFIDESTVDLTGASVNLGSVSVWKFSLGDGTALAADACLEWYAGNNDFSGDTLAIETSWQGTGEALTVFRGSENTMKGWENLALVTLNGTAMTKEADGGYVSDDFSLRLTGNSIVLASR